MLAYYVLRKVDSGVVWRLKAIRFLELLPSTPRNTVTEAMEMHEIVEVDRLVCGEGYLLELWCGSSSVLCVMNKSHDVSDRAGWHTSKFVELNFDTSVSPDGWSLSLVAQILAASPRMVGLKQRKNISFVQHDFAADWQ